MKRYLLDKGDVVWICKGILCCGGWSVTKLCPTLWPCGLQHARLPRPLLPLGVCSNSCPLSWWCYLIISFSVASFSLCLQSSPASGCFPMSQLFPSGGLSIGASALAAVLPMNIQGWFLLGLTSLISLQSKGLSKEFPLAPQLESIDSSVLSLLYGPSLTHDYWKNHSFDDMDLCWQNDISAL